VSNETDLALIGKKKMLDKQIAVYLMLSQKDITYAQMLYNN